MEHDLYLDVDRPYSGLTNRRGNLATRAMRIQMGATRLGISVEAYELHVEAGERWCSGHRRWCPADTFLKSKSSCREGHAESMRAYKAAKKLRDRP